MTFIVFTDSECQDFWKGSSGQVSLGMSYETVIRYKLGLLLRLDWGWRVCCWGGCLIWLASWCWLFSEIFSSSPQKGPHSMVACFPQSEESRIPGYRMQRYLLWPRLRRHTVTDTIFSCSVTNPAQFHLSVKDCQHHIVRWESGAGSILTWHSLENRNITDKLLDMQLLCIRQIPRQIPSVFYY